MGLATDAPISLRVDPRDVYLFSSGDERTITVRKPVLDT
jgi:multiple sugar transport system ATP-binding protein